MKDEKANLLDTFFTPKQLADKGIFSLVYQWQERKKGRLKHYQIGRKILYNETHISDFLALCESENQDKSNLEASKSIQQKIRELKR